MNLIQTFFRITQAYETRPHNTYSTEVLTAADVKRVLEHASSNVTVEHVSVYEQVVAVDPDNLPL